MAISALVVAVIAALIALASAAYARSQAIAAKGALAIEQARHRDELTPRFEATVGAGADDGDVLQLRLLPDQRPVAGARATIVQAAGVKFDCSPRGGGGRVEAWHTAVWDGVLAPGSQAWWPLRVNRPGNSDEVILEVSDLADVTRVAAITVKLPPGLLNTIW